jgi:hypothetical protein
MYQKGALQIIMPFYQSNWNVISGAPETIANINGVLDSIGHIG